MDNFSAGRVGSVLSNVGSFESFAVCPPGMAVEAFDIHRSIGNDGVKKFFIGQSVRWEQRITPSAAKDPWILGMSVCILLQAAKCFIQIFRIFQIDALKRE